MQTATERRRHLARRINLPFWMALMLVTLGYVGAFYILRLLVPQQEIAGTLAALTLGGGPWLQRAIEGRLHQANGPVVPMARYLRPWPLILVLGAGAIWLSQAIVPWIQLRGGPVTAVASNVDALLSLLPPAAALGVGLVSLAAVLTGWFGASLTYNLVVGAAVGNPGLPPAAGQPPNPIDFYFGSDALLGFALSDRLPLLAAAGLAGYWYGTRTRLQAYLGGLLRAR